MLLKRIRLPKKILNMINKIIYFYFIYRIRYNLIKIAKIYATNQQMIGAIAQKIVYINILQYNFVYVALLFFHCINLFSGISTRFN